jgi:hypothetical protein
MKKLMAVGAALALLLVLAAPANAAPARKTLLAGTISGLDMDQRSMVVKDARGVDRTVFWNEATYLDGGPLQLGADVRLQASTDESGKLVASSIQVKAKMSKASKPESGPNQK